MNVGPDTMAVMVGWEGGAARGPRGASRPDMDVGGVVGYEQV